VTPEIKLLKFFFDEAGDQVGDQKRGSLIRSSIREHSSRALFRT